MADIQKVITDTEEFVPTKPLLLCIDSDGCAINSMTSKHTLCFGPLMIKEWELWEHEKEILALWNRVNLYSSTRGVNRFVGLATVLSEVDSLYCPVVGIEDLLRWSESDELSERSLMQKIEANREVDIFKKALLWSRAVNRATAELGDNAIHPFEGVSEALIYAGKNANVAVVSGADPEALREEWTRYSLIRSADILLAQNAGSKSGCLAALLEKGYEKDKVLMCGDSMGDLDAAKQNGVFFYPILAGHENESWHGFAEAFDAFCEGRFSELAPALEEKFRNNLAVRKEQK